MKFCLSFFLLLLSFACSAQHTLSLSVKKAGEKDPLAGATATIASINRTAIADSTGLVLFRDLPAGTYAVTVSFSGLEERQLEFVLPMQTEMPVEVLLEEGEHEEEVIITTTRMSRSISDIPTRVETISGEELEEKSNMKPGDIRMLLNESTGIQTQQTSATSYNSSIRIQGLDGRYTQILRDGFPLYGGFSGSLSIMQITPLDLKQVEVIKGSSSTLYGGGAIAGLVNLISKIPAEERELSFLVNATSAGGLDLSSYFSERFGHWGLSVFGSANYGSPYDPADIGLTAIPKFERYTVNPRLFYFGDKTSMNMGLSYIAEERTGGSMSYFKEGRGYYEYNNTGRISTQLSIRHRLGERFALQFRNSFSWFDRRLTESTFSSFNGRQNNIFSELSIDVMGAGSEWIGGINFIKDEFVEKQFGPAIPRDYRYNTLGLFVQNTWSVAEGLSLESGLRADHVKQFGWELLPRFSLMYKPSRSFTMRLGGGLGYKTPTIFNEESERLHFRNVLPINEAVVENERSAGGNFDFNYRTSLGEVGFTWNQLFFYTRLRRPLELMPAGTQQQFLNAAGYIDTKGVETNIRFSYSDFKLFIGYTHANVNSHFGGGKTWFPLTAKHRLNNVLMYELEEKLKLGLEAYYFSPQRLTDNSMGKAYWIAGFMGERIWEKFSVFLNFENFTGTRQTSFDTIYTGSIDNPQFRDIYAPVDGFVVNGGLKVRL